MPDPRRVFRGQSARLGNDPYQIVLTKKSVFGLCIDGFPSFLAANFGPTASQPPYGYVFGLFLVLGRPNINQMTFKVLSLPNGNSSLGHLSRNNVSGLTAKPYRMDHTLPGVAPFSRPGMSYQEKKATADLEALPIDSTAVTNTAFNLTSHLRHHKEWAVEVFFSRSDLKLMYEYLTNFPSNYNDFFFSGTKVNYGNMANPGFDLAWRKGKHTLPDNANDPSDCFTLKAEPIFLDPIGTSSHHATSNHHNATRSSSGNLLPGLFTGAPCPFYWETWNKTVREIEAHPNSSLNFATFIQKFPDMSSFLKVAKHVNHGDIS